MVNKNPWGTVNSPETRAETEKFLGLSLDPFIVVQKGEPCRVQGCQSPIVLKVRGLCDTHKQAFYRNRREQDTTRGQCDVPWCTKIKYSKGYCHYHYDRTSKGLTIHPPALQSKSGLECEFAGCTRTSVSKGYCGGHYSQYYKGQTMRPIHRVVITDGHKECILCKQVKPLDDFYWRKNPKGVERPMGRCKQCWALWSK